MRDLGFATAAMALREDTVSIEDPIFWGKRGWRLYWAQKETGLADGTIADCDYTVRILYVPRGGLPECGGGQRRGLLAAVQRGEKREKKRVFNKEKT